MEEANYRNGFSLCARLHVYLRFALLLLSLVQPISGDTGNASETNDQNTMLSRPKKRDSITFMALLAATCFITSCAHIVRLLRLGSLIRNSRPLEGFSQKAGNERERERGKGISQKKFPF